MVRTSVVVAWVGLLCGSPAVGVAAGPDVIVADLPEVFYWGRVGTIHAYSVGTLSCNVGDVNLVWEGNTNQHPVIAQNLYRLKQGHFEQIGMSWVKHGFFALTDTFCGTCNGQGGNVLGVGCSDPYGAGLNGTQPGLGPRSEVNAANGVFPYPFVRGWNQAGDQIFKRIQVATIDVDPTQNAGALYFVEGHYVTPDDAAAGNALNNVSYRPATVSQAGVDSFPISVTGTTQRELPAILAWQNQDPNVIVTPFDVPGDGRLILAARATDLGDGFWHYEYALYNLNSDRAVGAFTVVLHPSSMIRNLVFHDVNAHSGEPYDTTDWPVTVDNGSINWASASFAANPNANALRWGTLYNFRFDANVPPADLTCRGDINADGTVNGSDVGPFVDCLVNGSCPGTGACLCSDMDLDGACTQMDVAIFITKILADPVVNGSPITIGLFKPGSPNQLVIRTVGPSPNPPDCNMNGVPDPQEIASGLASDCDGNGVPDDCDPDCNSNSIPDACDVDPADPDGDGLVSTDCNANGLPDECEIDAGSGAPGGPFFCTGGCDPDCNQDGIPDACQLVGDDCNSNLVPDECELVGNDCNANGIPDECELVGNDCNVNGVPDECDTDCNGNAIPDTCEAPLCPGIVPGDLDCNGVVDVLDTPAFVEALLAGTDLCHADMNADQLVNGLDARQFLTAVIGP